MAAGTYPIPLYRSAVDGLMISTDNIRQNLMPKRQRPCLHYPIMTGSQPFPNLLRSSTGSILHRLPNSRPFPTTLRPTSIRWDSAINIVDFKTRPLINQNSMIFSSKKKLVRSESLQIPNINIIIQKPKFDARHFCGLQPIQENKRTIREIPSFRPPPTMSR